MAGEKILYTFWAEPPARGHPARIVYVIRCRENGWVYVGKTGNLVRVRWSAHRSSLRRGKHQSPSLQADWSRLGEAAFDFGVILRLWNRLPRQHPAHHRVNCGLARAAGDEECRLIELYRSLGRCYNTVIGGK